MKQYDRVWATVNLDAVIANIKMMQAGLTKNSPDGKTIGLIGVVKADAYGHGLIPVATVLEPFVCSFAVATVDEALLLKEHRLEKPIMLLSAPNPRRFPEVVREGLQPAVYTWEQAVSLSQIAVSQEQTVKIHIAVDTGMSRIGMIPTADNADLVAAIAGLPQLQIEGIFTHFTKADEPSKDFSRIQAERFTGFLYMIEERGIFIPLKHISNSAAILELPDLALDAVRAGISIYGLYPSGDTEKSRSQLEPVLDLKSEITHVKEIPAGTPVSYGGTYIAEQTVKVATIAIGYGDGYPRNLSGCGEVLIKGKRAPILGRVCMDQMMVDVTGIEAQAGDEVTLIGRDGEQEIRVEELAAMGGGFHYEIVCMLGKRIPRLYKKDGIIVAFKDYFSDPFTWEVH